MVVVYGGQPNAASVPAAALRAAALVVAALRAAATATAPSTVAATARGFTALPPGLRSTLRIPGEIAAGYLAALATRLASPFRVIREIAT